MIKNERQYLITKKALHGFRESLAALERAAPAAKDAAAHAWQLAAVESQIATLAGEVEAYEQLQQPTSARAFSVTLEQLPALLIRARITRGWSQRELAARLGLQMQKVQQYEATDYAGASLARLLEVAQALGLTSRLEATLVELPDLTSWSPPTAAAGPRRVVRMDPVDMRRASTVKKVRREVASKFRQLQDGVHRTAKAATKPQSARHRAPGVRSRAK
jgi:HTH-type transcriptional regulator/antitoxin HipB